MISSLLARLDRDDIIIDGGNSDYLDTDRRVPGAASMVSDTLALAFPAEQREAPRAGDYGRRR